MSLRIYRENFVPKYENGVWVFNRGNGEIEFISRLQSKSSSSPSKDDAKSMFKTNISQSEEIVFIEKFQRRDSRWDNHVITIQDIKDLVLFLAKPNKMSAKFIDFFHTETVNIFLNSLVIYFEYYLKILEYILIHRDEMNGTERKQRNNDSNLVEEMVCVYISQYRLMLGRSYSRILLGVSEMAEYHHMANKMTKSYTEKDRIFTETFFSCCKEFTWIAMHRRLFNEIDYEFDRLFRCNEFQIAKKQSDICNPLTSYEETLLYGHIENNLQKFKKRSPLIMELLQIEPKYLELLWIGVNKYEGNDPRLQELEYEYVTPESQLCLADIQHGILGHPKKLYNTMLELDLTAVRKEKFTETNDPYCLIRQPKLIMPDWREFQKVYERVQPVFGLIDQKYDQKTANQQRIIWRKKEKLVNDKTKSENPIFQNLYLRADNFLKRRFYE